MSLYKHQQDIINDDPKKCGLFLGTGSSKTRIALELAQGSVLVICPKTTKEDRTWERENEKWSLHKDISVISKETFRRDVDTLHAYTTIIIDEAHTTLGVTPNIRWKNKKPIPKTSQLFEALEIFVERTKPERLYLCTATIMKSPMTVWGAAQILGKNWNFYEFRDAFYFKLPIPGREAWLAKSDTETKERLAKAVKKLGYVGRLENYFDVPPQTYKTIYCELTAQQKERIKQIKMEYPDPIVRIGKVHQLENGVLSGDEFSKAEVFENSKIDTILDLSIEFPRMIVFAKYTAQIAQIEAACKKAGKMVFTMTGDTKDRGSLLEGLKDMSEYIFIVQAQISYGWELPECPVMVFASRTYSFVDYEQSLGRVQRSNAIKKNLYINLVVKGGVDEAVDKCLMNKKDFNEKLYEEK